MKRKILFCCILLIALLSACVSQPPQDTVISQTTQATLPPPQEMTITAQQLGAQAISARSEAPEVFSAELLSDGQVKITSLQEGQGQLRLVTPYGEHFLCDVQCDAGLNITVAGGYTPPAHQVWVTDFGAVADDEIDDTAAIQAAIDSLTDGGTVYIPKGVYLITQLILRENVSLRLEGAVAEPTLGYAVSGASVMIENGAAAVLRTIGGKAMFLNHDSGDFGRNGCGNVAISGGVIDMQGKRCSFIFSCAENVKMENIVFLNGPNNHAIQLGGCQNVTIRDCTFAGYNYSNNNTGAETIQIEQTHPGAMGAVGNTPSIFEEGEHYFCENVQILDCWFGPSEQYDSPTYAIGHHGQSYRPAVTGLVIQGCVFDNCRCSAISYPAFSDVVIRQNTFINDRDNCVSAQDSLSQVNLYLNQNDVYRTVTDEKGETTVAYYAKKEQCIGSIGTLIEENTFILDDPAGRYLAVNVAGNSAIYDLVWENGALMVDSFTATPEFYTGPIAVKNVIEDLTLRNNCVQAGSHAPADGYYYAFSYVRGLLLEGNRVEGQIVENSGFRMDGVNYPNCRITSCTTAAQRTQRILVEVPRTEQNWSYRLTAGDEEMHLIANSLKTVTLTIIAPDGEVNYTIGDDREVLITVTPPPGKTVKQVTVPSTVTKEGENKYLFFYSAAIQIQFE